MTMAVLIILYVLLLLVAVVVIGLLVVKYMRLRKQYEFDHVMQVDSSEPVDATSDMESSESADNWQHKQTEGDKAFLNRLRQFIDEEMSNGEVKVETLADKMCLSRSQLNRKVKAITGMSTLNFSSNYRLCEASRLLREQHDMIVSEIARKCGFDDAAYFARVFRQFTGQSPTAYRKAATG